MATTAAAAVVVVIQTSASKIYYGQIYIGNNSKYTINAVPCPMQRTDVQADRHTYDSNANTGHRDIVYNIHTQSFDPEYNNSLIKYAAALIQVATVTINVTDRHTPVPDIQELLLM